MRFFFWPIYFLIKSLGVECLVKLKMLLNSHCLFACHFIHGSSFSCLRCWELSAGNIKWIYQAPILAAIGVSVKSLCSGKKGIECTIKLLLKLRERVSVTFFYKGLGDPHIIAIAVGRVWAGIVPYSWLMLRSMQKAQTSL